MKQRYCIFLFLSIFVTLPVQAACTVITTGGNFETVTTKDDISNYSLSEITVTCDNATDSYTLGIDAGENLSGTRQLKYSNNKFLSYQLFQGNSANEWGDKNMSPTNYPQNSLTGSGTQTHQIYASATTKDQAPQGLYTDTVTILLEQSGTTTITTAHQINLTLEAFCTLDASNISGQFGDHAIGSANLSNINLGALTVNCPNTIAYKIGIDEGLHLTAEVRQMAFDNNLIAYTLKQGNDGAEWGDKGLHAIDSNYTETFATADALSNTGSGALQSFDLYGDAIIQTINTVGTYTDTLTITLVW